MNGTVAPSELQARLETDIAATQARLAAARHSAALRDADIREALRAELEASRVAVAAMELEYETMVTSLREQARIEVDRIFAEARAARSVDGGSADVE